MTDTTGQRDAAQRRRERRSRRVIAARHGLSVRRRGGRAWLNGREVGDSSSRYAYLEASHDQHREDGETRINGATPLRLAARELGLTLNSPHETTVSGHLIDQLGRVLQAGKSIHVDGALLEVLAADDAQVSELAVRSATRQPDRER